MTNDPTRIDKAWTFRRVSFGREGVRTLRAIITDGRNIYGAATQIGVQEFDLTGQKSIILYIGDAMGTAYRDAGRIVAQSTGNHTGSSVPITAEGAGALLFFGYFDQTNVFFKMARVLSTNTRQLDRALERKLEEDVPPFNPPAQLRMEENSIPIVEPRQRNN